MTCLWLLNRASLQTDFFSVKLSLSSLTRQRNRKEASSLAKVSSIADLVTKWRSFQVGDILHRYIGCQTQVIEDNQEIGAFMFRRTVPAVHLTSEDVHWMVGAWRERIILCTGKYGLPPSLVKAFLDSGAKTVVSSSFEPPDVQSIQFHATGDYSGFENGRFEIGDEEAENDIMPGPASPASDWEDSDAEKGGEHSVIWNGDDEEDLSEFVYLLYNSLFREGSLVDVALQHALHSHPKLRYGCPLPNRP